MQKILVLVAAVLTAPAQADRIYQWVDERGVTNFGNRPPAESGAAYLGDSQPSSDASHYDDPASINLRAARIYNSTRAARPTRSYGPDSVDQAHLKELNRDLDIQTWSRVGNNNARIRSLQQEKAAIYGKYGIYAPPTDYSIEVEHRRGRR